MGKDYRHKAKNRIQQFDEDGYDGFHKLEKYDREKTRKKNKVDPRTVSPIEEETIDNVWVDMGTEE